MPRLSKLLEKIEDLAANRWGSWYERNKARVPLYAVLGGLGWYFYGMLLNSLRLGKESVFHMTGEKVESIWVLNPFKNFFVVLTPFGLGTTAACSQGRATNGFPAIILPVIRAALTFSRRGLTAPPALRRKESSASIWSSAASGRLRGCSSAASRGIPMTPTGIPPTSLTA